MPHTDRARDAGSARRRDRGLRRVKLTTVAIGVTAAAGSVALGAGYATALPGASSVGTPHPATAPPSRTSSDGSAPAAGGRTSPAPRSAPSTPLQPPTQAPAAAPTTQAPQPVHTTSGGS